MATEIQQIFYGHIIYDFDNYLTQNDVLNIFAQDYRSEKYKKHVIKISKNNNILYLIYKNITYLGYPHKNTKKRFQFTHKDKNLLKTNSKSLLLGIYSYRNQHIFYITSREKLFSYDATNTSIHINIDDLIKASTDGNHMYFDNMCIPHFYFKYSNLVKFLNYYSQHLAKFPNSKDLDTHIFLNYFAKSSENISEYSHHLAKIPKSEDLDTQIFSKNFAKSGENISELSPLPQAENIKTRYFKHSESVDLLCYNEHGIVFFTTYLSQDIYVRADQTINYRFQDDHFQRVLKFKNTIISAQNAIIKLSLSIDDEVLTLYKKEPNKIVLQENKIKSKKIYFDGFQFEESFEFGVELDTDIKILNEIFQNSKNIKKDLNSNLINTDKLVEYFDDEFPEYLDYTKNSIEFLTLDIVIQKKLIDFLKSCPNQSATKSEINNFLHTNIGNSKVKFNTKFIKIILTKRIFSPGNPSYYYYVHNESLFDPSKLQIYSLTAYIEYLYYNNEECKDIFSLYDKIYNESGFINISTYINSFTSFLRKLKSEENVKNNYGQISKNGLLTNKLFFEKLKLAIKIKRDIQVDNKVILETSDSILFHMRTMNILSQDNKSIVITKSVDENKIEFSSAENDKIILLAHIFGLFKFEFDHYISFKGRNEVVFYKYQALLKSL